MYLSGTHDHVYTNTNMASTHTYAHMCICMLFSMLLMVFIYQYKGVLTRVPIQTSVCKCTDASVLGHSVRPLAIWINYVMACKHSILFDLDRKDWYRNLPSQDNIWASSKVNKNTHFKITQTFKFWTFVNELIRKGSPFVDIYSTCSFKM